VQLLATEPWEIVHLGYLHIDGHQPPAGEVMRLRAFDGEIIGAHCWLVAGSVIPELIDFLEGLLRGPVGDPLYGPMPIDGALHVFRGRRRSTKRFVFEPSLARQRHSRSDVRPGAIDVLPIAGSLVEWVRRARNRSMRP